MLLWAWCMQDEVNENKGMCLSKSQSHFPAEMIPQYWRGAHCESKAPSCLLPPLLSASLSVASWAHPQHGDTSQASGSSVFRNGRVGATDTHRYPAAYYFLPALAPLQGPAWQVDEVHEKAQQRASFPGMLLLTGFTNQATLHHPRLNGEPTEWGQRVFFLFFFFFLCLQSGSCDCFSWYKQLPSQAPGFEVFPRPCKEQRCLTQASTPSRGSEVEEWKEEQCPWERGVREHEGLRPF